MFKFTTMLPPPTRRVSIKKKKKSSQEAALTLTVSFCRSTTFTSESQAMKLLLQSSWLASCCCFPRFHQDERKKKSLRPLSCADTIPCLLTSWSDWSDCSVTCGKGLRTRQRTLKSPVELGDCTEELEQVEKCMLPECRKYASCFQSSETEPRGARQGLSGSLRQTGK